MQGIEFEEDKNFQGSNVATPPDTIEKKGFIIDFLAKAGITDKSTANLILLGVAAIFFGITIFLYAGILGENIPPKQSVAQIEAQARVMREMMGIK